MIYVTWRHNILWKYSYHYEWVKRKCLVRFFSLYIFFFLVGVISISVISYILNKHYPQSKLSRAHSLQVPFCAILKSIFINCRHLPESNCNHKDIRRNVILKVTVLRDVAIQTQRYAKERNTLSSWYTVHHGWLNAIVVKNR